MAQADPTQTFKPHSFKESSLYLYEFNRSSPSELLTIQVFFIHILQLSYLKVRYQILQFILLVVIFFCWHRRFLI